MIRTGQRLNTMKLQGGFRPSLWHISELFIIALLTACSTATEWKDSCTCSLWKDPGYACGGGPEDVQWACCNSPAACVRVDRYLRLCMLPTSEPPCGWVGDPNQIVAPCQRNITIAPPTPTPTPTLTPTPAPPSPTLTPLPPLTPTTPSPPAPPAKIPLGPPNFWTPTSKNFYKGMNIPWKNYGWDFGTISWGDGYDDVFWAKAFAELASTGSTLARVFILGDGRCEPNWDLASPGLTTGLSSKFFTDIDSMLYNAYVNGIQVLITILDFHIMQTHGDGWPAEVPKDLSALINNPTYADTFVDKVVLPIAQRYSTHPAVFGYDLVNEPEWTVGGNGDGKGTWTPAQLGSWQRYVARAAAAVHKVSLHPVTVGAASLKWQCSEQSVGCVGNWWGDSALQAAFQDPLAKLDFYAPHYWKTWQDVDPYSVSLASFNMDKPVMIGELSDGQGHGASSSLGHFCTNNFMGAMFWSMYADQSHGKWENFRAPVTQFTANDCPNRPVPLAQKVTMPPAPVYIPTPLPGTSTTPPPVAPITPIPAPVTPPLGTPPVLPISPPPALPSSPPPVVPPSLPPVIPSSPPSFLSPSPTPVTPSTPSVPPPQFPAPRAPSPPPLTPPTPITPPPVKIPLGPAPAPWTPASTTFYRGVNIPWQNYAWDFGQISWGNGYNSSWWASSFAALANTGSPLARVFILGDGRAEPVWNVTAPGLVSGLSNKFFADVDDMLYQAYVNGVQVLMCLLDFHVMQHHNESWWPVMEAPANRSGLILTKRNTDVFVNQVVRRIAARYATHPAVFGYDLVNEPEWTIGGNGDGQGFWTQATAANWQYYVARAAVSIHTVSRQPVTVGSASMRWTCSNTTANCTENLWSDANLFAQLKDPAAKLDFYAPHYWNTWRDVDPIKSAATTFNVDKPVLIGELGTNMYNATASLKSLCQGSYMGALYWSMAADQAHGAWTDFRSALASFTPASCTRTAATATPIQPSVGAFSDEDLSLPPGQDIATQTDIISALSAEEQVPVVPDMPLPPASWDDTDRAIPAVAMQTDTAGQSVPDTPAPSPGFVWSDKPNPAGAPNLDERDKGQYPAPPPPPPPGASGFSVDSSPVFYFVDQEPAIAAGNSIPLDTPAEVVPFLGRPYDQSPTLPIPEPFMPPISSPISSPVSSPTSSPISFPTSSSAPMTTPLASLMSPSLSTTTGLSINGLSMNGLSVESSPFMYIPPPDEVSPSMSPSPFTGMPALSPPFMYIAPPDEISPSVSQSPFIWSSQQPDTGGLSVDGGPHNEQGPLPVQIGAVGYSDSIKFMFVDASKNESTNDPNIVKANEIYQGGPHPEQVPLNFSLTAVHPDLPSPSPPLPTDSPSPSPSNASLEGTPFSNPSNASFVGSPSPTPSNPSVDGSPSLNPTNPTSEGSPSPLSLPNTNNSTLQGLSIDDDLNQSVMDGSRNPHVEQYKNKGADTSAFSVINSPSYQHPSPNDPDMLGLSNLESNPSDTAAGNPKPHTQLPSEMLNGLEVLPAPSPAPSLSPSPSPPLSLLPTPSPDLSLSPIPSPDLSLSPNPSPVLSLSPTLSTSPVPSVSQEGLTEGTSADTDGLNETVMDGSSNPHVDLYLGNQVSGKGIDDSPVLESPRPSNDPDIIGKSIDEPSGITLSKDDPHTQAPGALTSGFEILPIPSPSPILSPSPITSPSPIPSPIYLQGLSFDDGLNQSVMDGSGNPHVEIYKDKEKDMKDNTESGSVSGSSIVDSPVLESPRLSNDPDGSGSSTAGATSGTVGEASNVTLGMRNPHIESKAGMMSGSQVLPIPSTAVDGMSTAVNGTSTGVNGTSAAVNGTSTAVNGTSAAVNGTSTAVDGTSTGVDGTSPAVQDRPCVQYISLGHMCELNGVSYGCCEFNLVCEGDEASAGTKFCRENAGDVESSGAAGPASGSIGNPALDSSPLFWASPGLSPDVSPSPTSSLSLMSMDNDASPDLSADVSLSPASSPSLLSMDDDAAASAVVEEAQNITLSASSFGDFLDLPDTGSTKGCAYSMQVATGVVCAVADGQFACCKDPDAVCAPPASVPSSAVWLCTKPDFMAGVKTDSKSGSKSDSKSGSKSDAKATALSDTKAFTRSDSGLDTTKISGVVNATQSASMDDTVANGTEAVNGVGAKLVVQNITEIEGSVQGWSVGEMEPAVVCKRKVPRGARCDVDAGTCCRGKNMCMQAYPFSKVEVKRQVYVCTGAFKQGVVKPYFRVKPWSPGSNIFFQGANVFRPTAMAAPGDAQSAIAVGFDAKWWESTLAHLNAFDANLIRVPLFGDGRAGLVWSKDEPGVVTGIEENFTEKLDRLLALAYTYDIQVLVSLVDYRIAKPTEKDNVAGASMNRSQLVINPKATQQFVDNVVAPLASRYNGHPALLAWEVVSEPEKWMGMGGNEECDVKLKHWQQFVAKTAVALHYKGVGSAVTVGSAHLQWVCRNAELGCVGDIWADRSLQDKVPVAVQKYARIDFYAVYSWSNDQVDPIAKSAAVWKASKPILLAELGTDQHYSADTLLKSACKGYMGALFWTREDLRSRKVEKDFGEAMFQASCDGRRRSLLAVDGRVGTRRAGSSLSR